jgi:hypothetical protein
MKILIGSSGLIGQMMLEKRQFDYSFNSKNINEFKNVVEDGSELFLTCLPATKWMVNKDLRKDMDNINFIIDTISKNQYSKVTLISTIDVYNDSPLHVNEDYYPNVSKLSYGNNRYIFELLVREYVKTNDLKIFRLPALYNKHIKKNLLYDLLNNNNIKDININTSYQWYNLDYLAMDIDIYNEYYQGLSLFNLFTEPLPTYFIMELFPSYKHLVKNERPVLYNYKTKYRCNLDGYTLNHNQVLSDIKNFVNGFSNK